MDRQKEKENPGLRLLRKGKRGLAYVLFSRTGLIVLLLLLNLLLVVALYSRFLNWLAGAQLLSVLLGIGAMIYLINSDMDASAKITWLVLCMLLPSVGIPLYIYIQSDLGHQLMKEQMNVILKKTHHFLPQSQSTAKELEAQDPAEGRLLDYMQRVGGFAVYNHCETCYFPSGESKFAALKRELRQAKRFIFMEYFIVDEGRMWGEILEILAQKAKEGLDVRFLYDGSCEFARLPHNYPELLKKLGIQCRVFAPATPFVSTHYNYRDHRKIAVIDGQVAFTGGVNLADEYINEKSRFGHWKDAALLLRGEAVRSFTLLFLQMWCAGDRAPEITRHLMAQAPSFPKAQGYVIPYGDNPLDQYRVGEMVYMDILSRASRYVHIMSPYLILDGELETALCFAAQRGVDVKLILPGIPDKKCPYALAKTHYKKLLDSGVAIYEYSPGFVHSKVFVSDDLRGVVGTINLDYRSLYHHFECAAYLYRCPCLADMEQDFQDTLRDCRRVDEEALRNRPLSMKMLGWLMKSISPLF